ncbi:hypothetical protein [Serratia odorifera]|uniref:hypothetical protein n=1 Tax=Serratia odorifera TaxID=618 RepID=UPI00235FAF95|nr:hypothetical protein [Serratia odorifera]
MTKNTGKEYEEFVGTIQQLLINSENLTLIKNIKVELNKKIIDRNEISRQFDVYWEFSIGGVIYKSVIECKDYASPITIDKIDALLGKTADIPGLRLIYATKTGYQSGAKTKAEKHQIDLLIVRETNDSDWVDEDGTPYLKKINLKIVAITQPRITMFTPFIDKLWLDGQEDGLIDKVRNGLSMFVNNTVIIDDISESEKYSIHDLENMITTKVNGISYGRGEHEETLSNAYMEITTTGLRVKIKGYKVDYVYNKPLETVSEIDFSEQIFGIVQNYISGEKKMIFKDGAIK